MRFWKKFPWGHFHFPGAALVLVSVVAVACGAPAEPQQQELAATPTPAQAEADTPTPTPSPTPADTPAEVGVVQGGTLSVGQDEMGKFEGHPSLSSAPRISVFNSALGEGTVMIEEDLSAAPMLAESWEINDTFDQWTFHLQPGVQFHKGYGEMTGEDWVYSYNQWAEGALHARGEFIGDFFNHPDGSVEFVDSHTVKIDAGVPWVDVRVFEFFRNQGGSSTWTVSKEQSEELGVEAASEDIAATGPWEIVEHRTGEFWRMEAVEDHWRQTPAFDELVFREIQEESSQIAGFQTGNLDTFQMAFDSIPPVEEVEGSQLVSVPNGGQAGLNMYGQTYPNEAKGVSYEAFDPSVAWVSSNPDPSSPEWEDARKVREAMAISIDRESIVDTLLRGFGQPLHLRDWAGHEQRADPSWKFEFDPDRARQLLEEAGYGDGFSITLTPAIRGAPAEVEACEAVAQMWSAVGIDVDFQRIPYGTIRPSLISRNYIGATCHSVSIRLDPVIGSQNYVTDSVFSYGTEHPWMEEKITEALGVSDPAVRDPMVKETYQWMFDNVMAFGLYSFNAVWPAGPEIQKWEPVSYGDLRKVNGFELIEPRQ